LATQKRISIAAVCRQLGYSKQAYYKSLQIRKTKFCNSNIVKQKVLSLRTQMPRIGTRKLYYLLKESFIKEGISLGRDALFDLLGQEGLLIKKKKRYTKTTNSKHWMHKYPNLIKQLDLKRPEQLWVADITYITLAEGYCYLHLITDGYSKRIMGYHLSETLAANASAKALQMALANRSCKDNLIHHSDRGLQYCSALYTKLLQQNNIAISMTEDGSPYDNAIAERVNGILKDEFGMDETFENLKQANLQVAQSISIYNNRRPHMSNHFLTPKQMHQQSNLTPKAWHKKTTRTFDGSCGFLPSHNTI
jgi:transposase InsO family protein